MAAGRGELIPGHDTPWFRRAFVRWMRGFVGRRFHAVRLAAGSDEALARAASNDGPLLLVANHQSWWDPLVGLLVHDRWFGDRPVASPIDRTQLENFRFFRRLGMFGVDPDDATGLRAFARHVDELFARAPRTVLMVTPQGRFVDVRHAVEVRPGAAMVAARHPRARVIAMAIEYAFWVDQRPEVFLRAECIEAPPSDEGSAHAWQDAIAYAMNANAAALAEAVMSREAGRFSTVMGGGAGRIHPAYDAFLRLTGRRTSIDTSHRAASGGGA